MLPFIKELYAFRGLPDEAMAKLAELGEIVELKAEQRLPVQGGVDAPFFMVISGRVALQEEVGRKTIPDELPYKAGMFFGADKLLYNTARSLTATALVPTQLLRLESNELKALLLAYPKMQAGLAQATQVQQWLHKKAFRWVGEDELVYWITRKHPIFLLVRLVPPVLGLAPAFLALVLAYSIETASFRLVLQMLGWAGTAAMLGWLVWRYIDWGNDYYVVTNQRVVWIEQVLGLYNSQREAVLSAIRNRQVRTANWLERQFDYGDILLTVYAGQLVFKNIPEPGEVNRVIEYLQRRADVITRKQDVRETQKIIRSKILEVDKTLREEMEPVVQAPPPKPKPPPRWIPTWQEIRAFFRIETRFEQGDTITYRTHILFLLLKLSLPGLGLAAVLGLSLWMLYANLAGQITFPSIPTTLLSAFFISGLLGAWMLYHFVDWRNDIYQISPDRVLDKDHKPFQEENINQAFLNNIQSMEIERENILEMLFNFGTLVINAGTDQRLTFDNIPDPARALQDVYSRLYKMDRSQKLAELRKQADQQAFLVATYHLMKDELPGGKKDNP